MERCVEGATLVAMEEEESRDLSLLFKMFSDPSRIKILALLEGKEVCVNHISSTLGMSISAVSQQLRLLRNQKLVRYVKDGKQSFYTLDDDHVSTLLNVAREHISH